MKFKSDLEIAQEGVLQDIREIGCKKTIVALREPALGPVFGVKGGGK